LIKKEPQIIFTSIIEFILHLDIQLGQIIISYGIATYALLFAIIFIETGLVFVPFLPGDSLLFASGAFAALGSLNIVTLLILLIVAALLGDTLNYWAGHFVGAKIIANKRMPIKEEHLEKTSEFFKKYGGKTIILARFVPIIRTFAPFVAGAGKMNYGRFIFFNVIGGVLWVSICTMGGYYFGNIPFVKDNFSVVIIGVVALSLIPIFIEFWQNRRKNVLRVNPNSMKNSTRIFRNKGGN
jgi:membrane-associated protein